MNSIKSGKLIEIEKITTENEGETLRVLGTITEKNNTFYICGLSGSCQELNLSLLRPQINLGFPYMIIGVFQNNTINVRILKEVNFKKYSLDYYLKVMPSLHNELIE